MLKDILVTFECPRTFTIRASLSKKDYDYKDQIFVHSDKETNLNECKVKEPLRKMGQTQKEFDKTMSNFNATVDAMKNSLTEKNINNSSYTAWHRVEFTLFSMLVSASFFAAYNITTFYTAVVFTAGGAIRIALIFNTFMGWMYETTVPDGIIKIVEAVTLARHEGDLVGEEEYYRMLQEIMR